MTDLSVKLGQIELKNPIIPASGTFGFGLDMKEVFDLNILGGIALKGTTRDARFGNPTPRIAECERGLLNAIGLQNPGVEHVVQHELPALRQIYNGVVLANISGFSLDEYVHTAKMFDECDGVDILEINISCPNVKCGGMAFGTQPDAARQATEAVKSVCKKPVYMMLPPNVTDIVSIARACEDGGAAALVLLHSLLGMAMHPLTAKPFV